MSSCVFCEIVAGRGSASVVYSDALALAFMDTRPVNRGHLLVVPRAHSDLLSDLPPHVGGHLFRIAMEMAAALRVSGIPCEGVNLYLADGPAAGQEVSHIHLHVLPRFPGDGFAMRFPPGYADPPSRSELDEDAAMIRGALEH